jgi:uncharacterized protein YegL
MNDQLTDITLVIDRSGSMQSIKRKAEKGINGFIDDQKKQPGEANLSLIQFDTEFDFLHKGTPINQVGNYQLEPRGGTALLDAVGQSILNTGERLSSIPEANRPGLVIFVIMTDGEENSSTQFSRAQIRQMVEHQQTVYNWQFTYLGANQDAFGEAAKLGIRDDQGTANFSADKVDFAYDSTSSKVKRMRNQRRQGETVSNAFVDEETEAMR